MGSKKDIARVAGDERKQRAVGTQTRGELKGNMTVAETPGSKKSERTGKANRPNA
jgi:hypothetical protein